MTASAGERTIDVYARSGCKGPPRAGRSRMPRLTACRGIGAGGFAWFLRFTIGDTSHDQPIVGHDPNGSFRPAGVVTACRSIVRQRGKRDGWLSNLTNLIKVSYSVSTALL
jgi:hypothetical protein